MLKNIIIIFFYWHLNLKHPPLHKSFLVKEGSSDH